MKHLKEGEEMPIDFWNYNVNPITGYYVGKLDDTGRKVEKKYYITTQKI